MSDSDSEMQMMVMLKVRMAIMTKYLVIQLMVFMVQAVLEVYMDQKEYHGPLG